MVLAFLHINASRRWMAKKVKVARNLRELAANRRHPAVMADITSSTQTDRAVAIIGAAYVDLVLLEATTPRLARSDANLINVQGLAQANLRLRSI
jgi:hypothetical protein